MRTILMLSIATVAIGLSGPSFAQTTATAAPGPVEPTQRCTGVLCDAYYAMHPNGDTLLPCHDMICGAFGSKTADAAPAPQAPAVEPVAPVAHKAHRKRVKVASKAAKDGSAPDATAK